MSKCHVAWIFDEFDWKYVNLNKGTIITKVLELVPHARILANFHQWLIVDLDKTTVEVLKDKISYDKLLESNDEEQPIPKELT